MSEYWVSNERKFCDFCKCWLSDNKASISFHENGKRHQINLSKRLTEISRNSALADRDKRKHDATIRKMEDAAMQSYARDIHSGGDLTAKTVGEVMNYASRVRPASVAYESVGRQGPQVDPMRLPGNSDDEDEHGKNVREVDARNVPDSSLWVESKSDEGHTYYWNVKTNESKWEAPTEGFLTYAEYQRINDVVVKQQELKAEEEAKRFRENANEEVARYNRERFKVLRKPAITAEKKVQEEKRETFKTEEESFAPNIGDWQVVDVRPPPMPIDLELPKIENHVHIPVFTNAPSSSSSSSALLLQQPPSKRFKEKTIDSLDPELACNTATSFKKRKFAAKGSMRQRLDD